jgi:2-oxoisovalerate dehydrogenase E2 component (dihydrolipoyl transacylase)
MTTVVHMPEVAESVVEGTIARWLKQEGQMVAEYDPLVEVVTDKVTVEIPSPVKGRLSKILVQANTKVPVGAVLAHIEDEAAVPAGHGPSTPSITSSPIGGAGGDATAPEWVPTGRSAARPESRAPAPAAPVAEPRAPAGNGHGHGGPPISPLARRLAAEHGIDLGAVSGTGLGGRVRKQDILAYVDSAPAPAAAPAKPQAAPTVVAAPAKATPTALGAPAPVRTQAPAQGAGDVKVPLTPIRAMIAQHMVMAVREVPHAWTTFVVDATNLVAVREAWKEKFRSREGVPLTYLPFFVKAVVEALKEHPMLNSVWGGDHILLKKEINISVAIDREEGLIVPVLRNADRHSIAGLAHELDRLVNKAKTNRLAVEDVQGGTFTVNNTGTIGSVISQPIINHPQTAILATEAIVKQPVVLNDAIAIRAMMNLSISFDHRVLDGGQVGRFMQTVKRGIESYGPETKVY